MKATERLHEEGQSLRLDNITRKMLDSGQLARYVDQYAITGLTSNPSIFDKAIESRHRRPSSRRFHDRTDGVDGWVSLELSPLLAYDTNSTIAAAKALHERAGRPNLFIKIPGTAPGRAAIEECIASGVPINVTRGREAGAHPQQHAE